MPSEFSLIERHFTRPARHHGTLLGVGDDGALVRPAPGMDLVITTDMLVSGTHFTDATLPEDLGWKTLAVNVSDLAAMGAQPRWAVMAAALPAADEAWISAFASGFFACAEAFGIDLIGGDTTRGPLTLAPTVFGEVPQGQVLTRSGARAGDDIWVSGTPGLAAIGLCHRSRVIHLSDAVVERCLLALDRPRPRLALGLALRNLASAAIDLSDGLLADLRHILERSGLAADLADSRLPRAVFELGVSEDLARQCLLAGGDDYELVFTAPAERRDTIRKLEGRLGLPLSRIGCVREGTPGELVVRDRSGAVMKIDRYGYDHFAADPPR